MAHEEFYASVNYMIVTWLKLLNTFLVEAFKPLLGRYWPLAFTGCDLTFCQMLVSGRLVHLLILWPSSTLKEIISQPD